MLSYQRFVTKDGKIVHGRETYVDSAAALAHLQRFQKNFAQRFLEMVDRTRFTVFGIRNRELRRVLEEFGATYLEPFGDFAYWE